MRNKHNYIVSTMLCVAVSLPLQAQTVTNVVAEQVGKTVEISYTLDKATEVRAEFSTDGTTYTPLKSVSGAVGKNVVAGRNKIVWNPLLDYDKIMYENVWFRVIGGMTVTDCQGHIYPVVKIGNQYWMAENLQCTKYDTQSECAGQMLQTSSRSTYDPYYTDGRYAITEYSRNLTNEQREHLGLLYNWAAAMGYSASQAYSQTGSYRGRRQGICPNGWHLSNQTEWLALSSAVGTRKDGIKLKSKRGWYRSIGTDDYGFCGLPAGYAQGGSVFNVGEYCDLWTSDAESSGDVWYFLMTHGYDRLNSSYRPKSYAQSVRCVKD